MLYKGLTQSGIIVCWDTIVYVIIHANKYLVRKFHLFYVCNNNNIYYVVFLVLFIGLCG